MILLALDANTSEAAVDEVVQFAYETEIAIVPVSLGGSITLSAATEMILLDAPVINLSSIAQDEAGHVLMSELHKHTPCASSESNRRRASVKFASRNSGLQGSYMDVLAHAKGHGDRPVLR